MSLFCLTIELYVCILINRRGIQEESEQVVARAAARACAAAEESLKRSASLERFLEEREGRTSQDNMAGEFDVEEERNIGAVQGGSTNADDDCKAREEDIENEAAEPADEHPTPPHALEPAHSKPREARRRVFQAAEEEQAVECAREDSQDPPIEEAALDSVPPPPPPPPKDNSYNARKRTLQVMQRRKRDAALVAAAAAMEAEHAAAALKAGLDLARVMRVRHLNSPDMQFFHLRNASAMIHQRMSEAAAFVSSTAFSSATSAEHRRSGRKFARETLRYHVGQVWLLARLRRSATRRRHAVALGNEAHTTR